jgi:glycosyltransferase involved in cell wall biosynthesis
MPEPFKGLKNFKMAGYTLVDRFVTRWFVDKVVAVSFDLETVLAPIYGTDRVTCIHNGIDLETVHVAAQRTVKRKEWQIDDRAIVIGTVGRLVPVKGQSILLESFRTLRNSKYNVKLLLVGDGPLRGHLEAEVKRLSLEQEVLFAGHQEQSYDFINMMDIFVLPSLHEGIPMVLLEALALKKPVIASRVGGIPEVVSHGTSGILVKPANPDELATGLKRLVEDHEKAQQLGNAGRCRVEQEFDASLMAARTAAVYQSLCKPANR